MINFFRKTRKKMADDNRPLKYMRYAVGEIALVVIGILIALSINNWNEERQERKVRDSYYLSIINSFDKDLQEIQDYSNYIEASEKNINEIKAKVKNAESYKEASQYFTSFNFRTTDCDLNASIWESLVNSGDIGLLDENIKSSLLNFWKEYSDYYESDFANKQHYWDLIKSSVVSSESKVSPYSYDIFKDNNQLIEEAEKSRDYMKEVHSVLFAIAFRESGNWWSKNRMKHFKNEIEKIKSAMLKELDE